MSRMNISMRIGIPCHFPRSPTKLAEAKLNYAASASILDNLPAISIPAAAHELLQSIKDPIMRETTRDYFVNQQFRRDIFVKGPRMISPYDHGKRVEGERFILLGDPAKCPEKITTAIGDADLRKDIYQPVVKALAKFPEKTATVGELLATKELEHSKSRPDVGSVGGADRRGICLAGLDLGNAR